VTVASSLSIRCEAGDFGRLRARAVNWDDVLKDTLRAELGAAARPAARLASRNARRSRFPASREATRPQASRSTGLRSDLAASVDVALRPAGDGIEYRITSDHPLAQHTDNRKRWQHPVFGNREVWRGQKGSGWWTKAMNQSGPDMRAAADRALVRALRRL
jgi:hypothetical protein